MLDVLDLDALRAPDEERVGIGGIDDVGDLQAELARLGDVLVRGLDLDGEVVQQRPLRVTRVAFVELDERPAGLDARRAGRPGGGRLEATSIG